MKINQTTLMAGVASLALMVGTGIASAQPQQKGHNPPPHAVPLHAAAPPHAGPPPHAATQPHPAAPHVAARPHPAPPMAGRAAQQSGRVNRRVAQPAAPPRTNQHAQSVNRGNRANEGTTAQERRIPRGLQGNASGQMQRQPQLSEEQRTRIRQTVIDARGAPRVGHVDFDVRVGTHIPRGRIHLIRVPEYLVQIDPEWADFLYFIYEDEIVVVDPNDMEIVAVLPV